MYKRAVLAGMHLRRLSCLLAVAFVLPWTSTAHANDFDQFQNARAAYDSLNYELAAELFSGLLATATPNDTRPLVLESRKYLAATYLFLGRTAEGERQFEILLRAEPDYELDPLAFPAEVQRTFQQVHDRLAREREQAARQAERQKAQQQAEQTRALAEQKEQVRRLLELARYEHVEQRRSRILALFPFGIGQFQNGDNGLGLVFAVSETVLLTAAVTTFILHDGLPEKPEPQDYDDVQNLEQVYRLGNQVSMALFGVMALTGILDAQLRFRESTSIDRPRKLPPDLENFELRVGAGSLRIRARF